MTTATGELAGGPVPNHHAHHRGCVGVAGWFAARCMARRPSEVDEIALGLGGVARGTRVLDIGCGPGNTAAAAARRDATVVGLDPSATMLRAARKRHAALRGVEWRTGTAEELDLADESVDVALALATVHHWVELDRALANVRRVLVPGGCLVVIERLVRDGARGLASHGWTPAQADAFAARCTANGLADPEVARRRAGKYRLLSVVAIGALSPSARS